MNEGEQSGFAHKSIARECIAQDLFTQYGDVVFRRCRQLLGDETLAMDAVQEVFLRAIKARKRFKGECSPMTWLYRIATTYCLQALRNAKRRESKLARITAQVPAVTSGEPIEERLALARVLRETDDTTQQLAYYRFVDQMTMAEVAEVSGFSRKTVAKKLARFIADARGELDE